MKRLPHTKSPKPEVTTGTTTISCKACDLERYLNNPSTDLEACAPPALNHTCYNKGPKTKRQLLAAVVDASTQLHTSFSSLMPGGDYHSRQELDALEYRLAGGKL